MANAIALGAGSLADRTNTISVGNATTQRQIVNVAAGTANTDAVNVSQLKGVTSALGGGASVATDGSVAKPSYVIGGTTYNDVGSALSAAVQTNPTDAVRYDTSQHNRVTLGGVGATSPVKLTNVAAGSANSDAVNVKQLKDLGATVDTNGNVTNGFVAYDDATNANVTLKGASGTKIKNVAAGTLSAASMDAVNGSQLYQTNQNVANVSASVGNITSIVNNIAEGGGIKYFHANSTLVDSQAGGTDSVAIGGNAQATTTGSVALGSNTRVTANNAAAIGANSVADRANTVSVGASGAERQIVNVAVGSANTDAVNLKQLKDLGATVDANGNVTNGFVAYDDATKSKVTLGGVTATTPVKVANVAAGSANNDAVNVKQLKDLGATVDTSGNVTNSFVAYDDASKASVTLKGTSGTKIANVAAGAITSASKDAVNGSQLYQTNQNVANIGASVNNVANYYNTIVDGGGIKYFHTNSSLGDSLASADDAVAIGGNAQASASASIALGANAHATAANAVALGSGSIADRVNTISVGASGAERQVVNVAAGTASTDAVNVSQLKGVTTVLGGGADVAADGSIRKPQYLINGTTYSDVGSAIDAAARTGGTDVDAVRYDTSAHNKVTLGGVGATSPVKLTNVAAGSANSDAVNVKQLKDLGANVDTNGNVTNGFVAYDDSTSASVTLKGASGTKIKNVVAGVLSASSMEAVNGSQLYQTNQNVANLAGDFNNMSDTLNNLNDGGGLKYFHANSALADSQAGGANSVAIGGNAQATTADSVALGSNARTTAANSVALGSGSLADRANSVSVGAGGAERQIVNVAAGSQNTDAVNLKQLKDLGASFDNNGNVTSAFVAYDSAAKNKVTFGGVGATSTVKLSNVAAGSANTDAVNVKQLKDLGANVDTSGNVTNGFVAYDDASKASVTLKGASGTKLTNLIAGALNANSTDAVNGSQLYQTNQNVANVTNNLANLAGNVNNMSDTLNNLHDGGGLKYFHANSALADSQAGGANSVAIGGNAQATTADSVALGSNARTTAANSVALGSGSLADRANTVSVGSGGAERQIVNVAAGSQNTDAVNLKQLKDLGASFDNNGNVTSAFVAYDSATKNKVTFGGVGATSTVKLSNVAAGSANTDAVNVKQLKDLGATVDTNGNVTNGFVAYDDASKASVTLKGASGTKLTNLIAGALNANSTDAVNGSQLYQTNQNVANIGASVNNVSNYYNNLVEGGGIKYFHANSSLDDSLASGQDAIAIGGNAQANDTGAVAIGAGALADRSSSIAIGQNAQASAANSVALGADSSTTATLTTPAYQPGTTQLAGTAPVGEVSVGSNGNERRVTNVAAGAADTDAVNVSQLKSAVNASSSGVLAEAVIYDNAQHNSVTLGGTTATSPVALKNVAPGAIASGSRDAINGSQLYNVASTTAAALGGGAAVGSDGKIAAPTYVVSGTSYNDVGNALSAIGTAVNGATLYTKYFKVVPPLDPNLDGPALATGEFAMALGAGAAANGAYTMALGSGSFAGAPYGVAIGYNARATFANSVALGNGSQASAENTVSVGTVQQQRRIMNVADGIEQTDAVTVHQLSELQSQMLHATNTPRSMLLGAPNPLDFIAVSPTTTTTNLTLTSNDPNALAIGPGATSTAANTTSVGTMATAGGNKSTAVGAGAGAGRDGATAVGQGSAALGINTTVIGTGASTGFGAENAVSLGYMAAATGAGSMGFGANSDANGSGSIAFGSGSMTLTPATNSVALGASSVAARANTISVGNDTLQRQIVNVASGTSNNDAVNVSQLKGITTVLGGGAGIASDGSVTKPVYTIGGQTYSDVGAALNAAAASGGASPDAVSYDTAAHSRVTFGGATGAPVTLANVASGLLAPNSTEAINGAQLYNTASSVAGALGSGAAVGADGKVKAPTYTIGGSTYSNVGTALSAVDSALATGGNPNGVVYDSSARNKVTLGGGGASTPVTLTNLADAKADSDAVNLKQLKAAGIAVDPSTGLVTNALVAYDGASRSSVTFNAGGSPTQLKNVADAVDAFDAVNLRQMQSYVSTQMTNYTPAPTPMPVVNDLPVGTATGSDAIAIGNGANASGSGAIAIGARTATAGDQSVALGVAASAPATNAVALGANSVADRDNSVSMGAVGSERQITNVAAGTAATDAVNLGQMNSAISGVYKSMQDMDRDNKRGIAAASALNIVTPYLPGRTTLNAGVAGYRGTAALGVGVSRWNEKGSVNYNLGVSSAGGNSTIVRAGVGIVFGN
ncbi:YadA-like family protein [Paraburkholderia terrae]|uniref:YadA-like family protein n=1 Tax=Paraburkholderia terrae TaxID=311230 RepID=UPI00208A197F|nr:hypothetical protein CBA19C8_36935 [Paraburkholderia terrae]